MDHACHPEQSEGPPARATLCKQNWSNARGNVRSFAVCAAQDDKYLPLPESGLGKAALSSQSREARNDARTPHVEICFVTPGFDFALLDRVVCLTCDRSGAGIGPHRFTPASRGDAFGLSPEYSGPAVRARSHIRCAHAGPAD